MDSRGFRLACAFLTLALLLAPAMGFAGPAQEGNGPEATLSVGVTLDSNYYTWFSDMVVEATVTLSSLPVLGATVTATSAINAMEATTLLDDGIAPDANADDGIYTGYFRLGGENGTAVPSGSGNVLAVDAVKGGDSGSGSDTFTTFSAERWTGYESAFPPVEDNDDLYTNFVPSWTGTQWHHILEDFAIVSSRNQNDAMVRLPVFPKANAVTNVTVTGSGMSDIQVKDNVIQFRADLASGTNRFDVEFDSPSDLAATHIDRYRTGHIGLRQFRNGYVVWNEHVSQAIFGSPNLATSHGVGVAAGMQALDRDWNRMRSIDCMERVGIVCDGTLYNSGGSYPCNVKWSDQNGNSWLVDEGLDSMTFTVESLPSYCGGDIRVTRTLEFLSGERFIRNNYTLTNLDSSAHTATLLWGREQWLYGDTTSLGENDRGYVGGDPALYGSGFRVAGSAMAENYFGAVDIGSGFSLGILFNNISNGHNRPTYMYFLYTPPIRYDGGTYPVEYSTPATDEGSTFFEKQLGPLEAGTSAYHEFYMWGGYNYSASDVIGMVGDDAAGIANPPTFLRPLDQGWNLVSVPLAQADTGIDTVLASIDGDWDMLRAYDPSLPHPWLSNCTYRPDSLNGLKDLDRTMGLWLHVTVPDAVLEVSGPEAPSTSIQLRAGWNLVGYPTLDTTKTVQEVFAGTGADRVEVFDAADPYMLRLAQPDDPVLPGNGYWVRVPSDVLWIIDW